jgi:lysophospholipase L1-like esterase
MPRTTRALPALIGLPLVGAAAVSYALGSRKIRSQAAAHREYWLDRPTEDASFHVVFLGDSAAQGVGVSDPLLGYVGLVTEHLARSLGRPVAATNLSVSGATTADLIADQLPRLQSLDRAPDLVVCVIGANDVVKHAYEPTAFAERIESICAALPAGSVLGDIPCYGRRPWEARVERLNPLIHDAAARHRLVLARVHEATSELWPLRILRHVAEDLFHPNERGYRVWAGAVARAVDTTAAVAGSAAA